MTAYSVIGASIDSNGGVSGSAPPSIDIANLATLTADLALAAADPTISGNATALATVTTCQTAMTALSLSLSGGKADLFIGVASTAMSKNPGFLRRAAQHLLGELGLNV